MDVKCFFDALDKVLSCPKNADFFTVTQVPHHLLEKVKILFWDSPFCLGDVKSLMPNLETVFTELCRCWCSYNTPECVWYVYEKIKNLHLIFIILHLRKLIVSLAKNRTMVLTKFFTGFAHADWLHGFLLL